MKKYLVAILMAGVLMAEPGCSWFKQPSVQQQSAKTLFSLHKVVDASLDAYLDLVVQGKLPSTGVPKVMADYSTFQLAYNAAVELVVGNKDAVAPQAVLEAAAVFDTTLTEQKGGK